MKNRLSQHIPSSVWNGETPDVFEFETLAELHAIPLVKRAMESEGFVRLSQDDNCLMEEGEDGFFWWVLGYLAHPVPELPKWGRGKYRVEVDGKEIVVAGDLVASSCGDVVTLWDGRRARNLRD